MALRLFLTVLLVLVSPGMLLHYAWDGCHGSQNCPICHQAQGNPAESASEATIADGGVPVCEAVIPFLAADNSHEGYSSVTARAPPAC